METDSSEPNEDNVSDGVMEALMKSVIRNLRGGHAEPGGLHGGAAICCGTPLMGENRLVKMGKALRLPVPQHGASAGGLYQLQPRLRPWRCCTPCITGTFTEYGLPKFVKFAENVWAIPRKGKTDAGAGPGGIRGPCHDIQEVGLPTTLKELGVEKAQLKDIANLWRGYLPGQLQTPDAPGDLSDFPGVL